jgi:hypothetical protein
MHVSDSYAWVNTVEKDAYGYFFHPHHLLYIALAWRWSGLVHLAAPAADVWACMAALSAFFGCAGLAAVYSTLRLVGARTVASCAGAFLVAFGFGYWFFSSDAEVYVVSLSFGLWSFFFMVRLAASGAPGDALWAGVAAGLAALFHQTGIFLFVPALLVTALAARGGRRVTSAGAFAIAFGAVVAPPYVVCAWSVLPTLTPSAFVNWLTLFAGEGYGGFSISQTTRAPFGLARGFIGGQMGLDTLRGAAAPGMLLWCGLLLAVAAGFSLAVLSFHGVRSVRLLPRAARVACAAFAAAFVVYAGFGAYFDPVNFEWWTIPAALFTCAVAVAALGGPTPRVGLACATAALLLGANLVLDFSYRRNPRNDLVKVAAEGVLSLSGDQDVIVAPSYLGVVLWREAPGRRIFCPEEARRLHGASGARASFESLRQSDGVTRRVIVVGSEVDEAVRGLAAELCGSGTAGRGVIVGHITFFDGRRRIVETVGRVPVTAFEGPERRIASQ